MYIPYNLLLKLNIFHDFFYKKKIEQNCNFIAKNKKKVLKKLKQKSKLKVIFYVYDSCKWKCQSVYDSMINLDKFEPLIIVTRNAASNPNNPSYQTKEDIMETYNFFKSKNLNVELGYDFTKNKHIPLKNFNPDIIIYQHPWYVETSQGPVVCSKFALTLHIPYGNALTTLPIEYNLRFHQYVETYYVHDEEIKKYFAPRMDNNGVNLKAVGTTTLDYLYKNKSQNNKNYIIYAPHWTINHKNTIAYSTFTQTGQYILDFAKKHPEYNWAFKPHPMLKKAIIDNNFMTKEEVEHYYKAWETIGTACYDGNYFDLFADSQMMITDCCTFLIEYLPTAKPLIRLVSKDAPEYSVNAKYAIQNYYNVESIQDLEKTLKNVLLDKNDILMERRKKASIKWNVNATQNIINDILNQIK